MIFVYIKLKANSDPIINYVLLNFQSNINYDWFNLI